MFNRKKVCILIISTFVIVVALFSNQKVFADQSTDSNNYPKLAVPFFGVTLIPPTNQQGNNGYFDLSVVPGQYQTLELALTSTSDKEQKITVSPTNAVTSNGDIVASLPKAPIDSSMKYPFTSLGLKSFVVDLKPKEVKQVKLTFKIPDKEFDGVIIGGLFFQTSQTTESTSKAQDKKSTIKLTNDYSISTEVVLHENNKLVLADLKVKNIVPKSYRTFPTVAVNLQNPKMQYMNGLSVDAKVTRLADGKDVHQQKQTNMKFAPNSNFDYYIAWQSNQKMEPGKYRLDLKAKAQQTHLELNADQQKKQEWNISKEFTITSNQADSINRKNPNYKPSYLWLYIIIGVLIVIFIIFLFWYVFTLGRKKTNPKLQKSKK